MLIAASMLFGSDFSAAACLMGSKPPPSPRPATQGELEAVNRLRVHSSRMHMAMDADGAQLELRSSADPQQRPPQRPSAPRQRPSPPLCIVGDAPNVLWRAISPEELRAHPRVLPLPPASCVTLAGPDTFWWVRQDNELWDELHDGVLTSRHLLSALGLRERRAAKLLGFGNHLVTPDAIGHVWEALSRPPPPGRLDRPPETEVRAAHATNLALREAMREYARADGAVWPPRDSAARDADLRSLAARMSQASLNQVRCAWGSAQEAAALAALLEALPRGATLEEIGLAILSPDNLPTAELRAAALAGELPPLGASPDAMIRPHAGAPLEAVEVKNVCPFFDLPDRPRRSGPTIFGSGSGGGRGANRGAHHGAHRADPSGPVRRFGAYPRYLPQEERRLLPPFKLKAPHESVPTMYVPQVQVEMLVTGARVATYVSASASQGLNLIRIARDDAYLTELLHFLRTFWTSVRLRQRPSDELFWRGSAVGSDAGEGRGDRKARDGAQDDTDEVARYERFLRRTREISEGTRVSRHIARPWRRDASASADSKRLFLDGRIDGKDAAAGRTSL